MKNKWYNGFEIAEIEGKYYVLNENGWNGEAYFDCWETKDGIEAEKESYTIKPIYKEVAEDEFEIVGYELC